MAQLCQRQHLFRQRDTEVLVISFGTLEDARRWIEETCSPFTMLLDPDREVYRMYGLGRSWLRSWNPSTTWFYLRMLLIGRKWKGIQGDPNQLGGDFIVDAEGILRLVHPSQSATDRPAPDELLTTLREISRK